MPRAISTARLAAPLLLAGCAGLIAMAAQHAPRGYLVGNALALVLAAALALLPLRLESPRVQSRWIVAIVLVLALTAVAGPPLDGVRRWIPAGPLRLHAGMLLGPSLAVLLALAGPALRVGGVRAAIAIAAVAPDMAMALAWIGVLLSGMSGLRPGLAIASIALAALGLAATALRPDPLDPVPHVEAVIAGAWQASHMGGLALAAAALAPLALALLRGQPASALAGFWAGLTLASLLGAWPSPLIGFGAAPILGYGLSIAVWRGSQLSGSKP